MDEDEDINNGITLSNEGIFNCFKKEFFGVFFVCLIISIIGFAELTNGVVKTSLIGKNLGTEALAGYSLASNLINFSASIVLTLNNGIAGQISKHISSSNLDLAGKKINLAIILSIIWGLSISLLIGGLQKPLFLLFNAKGNVYAHAFNYFNYSLIGIPFQIILNLSGSVWYGINKAYIYLILVVVGNLIDMSANYICIRHFGMGMNVLAVTKSVLQATLASISVFLIYLPFMRKKYHINRLDFSWPLIRSFTSDSIFLVLRGFFVISIYILNPIAASNISHIHLSALSILNNLYFYMPIISQALSLVSNIRSSKYLGEKKLNNVRYVTIILPTVGLSCGIIISTIYILMKNRILDNFTNDQLVKDVASSAWLITMAKLLVSSPLGAVDGIGLSRKWYIFLFIVMVTSTVVYIPFMFLTLYTFKTIFFLQLGSFVHLVARLLPSSFRVIYTTFKEWRIHKKYDLLGNQDSLVN